MRPRIGLCLGLAVAVAAVTGSAASADDSSELSPSLPQSVALPDKMPYPNDPAEDPAVVSLVQGYGISTDQAIRQMERQVAAGIAEKEMPADLAASYTGRQIEHDRQGVITVAITDESMGDSFRTYFASYGVDDIVISIAAANAQTLDHYSKSMQQRIVEEVPLDTRKLTVSRGDFSRVTLEYEAGGLSEVESQILAEARSAPDVFLVSRVDEIRKPPPQLDSCDRSGDIECDAPFRGSVIMDAGNRCTAGFNTRSVSDLKGYVLTAGHCDKGGATWRTRLEDDTLRDIGVFHNSMNNGSSDTGIIRVSNESLWDFGWPYITVNPYHGGHAANDLYNIRFVLDPGYRDRVCFTGGEFPSTTCGEVFDTSFPGSGTWDLFLASGVTAGNFCAMGGDSGGPYFSYNVAYGIHITSDPGAGCGETVWAEHVLEAAAHMNVYVVHWNF